MRFICDNCGAKYSIADHKVKKKVLKIRCKRCANVIVVRDPSSRADAAGDAPASSARVQSSPLATGGGPVATVQRPSPRRSAFSNGGVTPSASPYASGAAQARPNRANPVTFGQMPEEEAEERSERTVIARISADWLKQIREEKQEEPIWFIAVSGSPVGPIVRSEVMGYLQRGEADVHTLVWCAGWANWTPAGQVPELKAAFFGPPSNQSPLGGVGSEELDNALQGLGESPSPFSSHSNAGLPIDEPDEDPYEATVIRSSPLISRDLGHSGLGGSPRNGSTSPLDLLQGGSPRKQEPTGIDTEGDMPSFSARPSHASKNVGLESALPSAKPTQDFPSPNAPFSPGASPFPQPTKEPPRSHGRQDVAMEERALPAELDQLVPPDLEEQFFESEVGFARSATDENVFEVTLPPLPEYEDGQEDFDAIEDADIIEEVGTMKAKWTSRFAVLGVLLIGGLLALPLLFSSSLKVLMPNNNAKQKLIRKVGSSRVLTADEKAQRDALLSGKAYVPLSRRTPKARITSSRKPSARRRVRVARVRRTVGKSSSSAIPSPTTPVIPRIAPSVPRLSAVEQARQEALAAARRRLGMGPKGGGARKVPKGLTRAMHQRIQNTIGRNMGKVKYCYERYLKKVLVKGRLSVEITIQPTGRVSRARTVTSRFRGQPISKCIRNNMMRWRFGSFSNNGPLILKVPFDLRPVF